MVMFCKLLSFLLLCFVSLFFLSMEKIYSKPVSISAEISQEVIGENQPIKGLISITHDREDLVDEESFLLDKEKLKVNFIKDIRFNPSDTTILSLYNFDLKGERAGVHQLKPVSVEVGGKEFVSLMSQYVINPSNQKKVKKKELAFLKITPFIDGKDALYIGQRTKLGYRYEYFGNIKLTKEVLPLLEAQGFIKIGEKEITDSEEGQENLRFISQEVESVSEGTFSFGPSLIEGRAYINDEAGDSLVSEAQPIILTVLPFPEKNKPASFNGAVGQFRLKTELLSPHLVEVGDELALSINILGLGNFNVLSFPNLCCQPGFSGFFKFDDLPPKETVSLEFKKGVFKLRLLTDNLEAIPSVEFSFFDPIESRYIVLHTEPIPLSIKINKNLNEPKTLNSFISSPTEDIILAPIDIAGSASLKDRWIDSIPLSFFSAFILVPLLISLLLYQLYLKNVKTEINSFLRGETSQSLFLKSFMKKGACNFYKLKLAFEKALLELKAKYFDIEELETFKQEIDQLFMTIDERRFSKNGDLNISHIRLETEVLMQKIKSFHPIPKELK